MKTKNTLNSENEKSLTKDEVRDVFYEGRYDCFYRLGESDKVEPYEGCEANLYMILEDEDTTVAEAEPGNADYQSGYRTILMNAPCFPAVILLRIKK